MTFAPAVHMTTDPATPSAIVAADFNNDGVLDLATCANAVTGSFSILLGNGTGGFDAARRTILASDLSSLAVADFNNDNNVDIVLSDSVGYYAVLGNGDGTFQPAVYSPGGYMVAVGDFENDGLVDVLGTWIDGDWATHIQVYQGNGQGSFTAAYDVPYLGWGEMEAVDMNGDGRLDVATGDGAVFLNSNGLSQSNQPTLNGGAIATGDFTGDGHVDALVASTGIAVLRGNGDGTLQLPLPYSDTGTYRSLATADFNGDGKLDAIATPYDGAFVEVVLGNGDGTLRHGGSYVTISAPSDVVTGDFNDDGRPDVAVAIAGTKTVSVLLNDGNWTAVPPALPNLSVSDTTVTEGDSGTVNASFVVALSKPALADVTVRYQTTNVTATEGGDYVAASGILTIPAGESEASITIAIKSDLFGELTETFTINLSSATNARMMDNQATGTIIDNDPWTQIRVNDVTTTEGNSRTAKEFAFTISLTKAQGQPVIVSYATASGTATANGDYFSKSGDVTFSPGETSKVITVVIVGDKQKELNETFFVNLSNAVGGEIIDGQGLGTIVNDDGGGMKNSVRPRAAIIDAAIHELMFVGRRKRCR